jgi:hypothetical protein
MSREGHESRGGIGAGAGKFCVTKKDGTNVFCSCREASDATYFQLRSGKLYQLLNWNIYTIA